MVPNLSKRPRHVGRPAWPRSVRVAQSALASQSLAAHRRSHNRLQPAVGRSWVSVFSPATPPAALVEKRMYEAPRRLWTGLRLRSEGSLSVASISSNPRTGLIVSHQGWDMTQEVSGYGAGSSWDRTPPWQRSCGRLSRQNHYHISDIVSGRISSGGLLTVPYPEPLYHVSDHHS